MMDNNYDDDGGPAFPVADLSKTQEPGMSLRDWFAGMALQGFIAQAGGSASGALISYPAEITAILSSAKSIEGFTIAADFAYKMADAMLKARKGR